MSDFVYLFRGGMSQGSAEEMQKNMQRWSIWMKELADKGHFKNGEPLESSGRVLKGNNKVVTDGPYAESKDLVGGFMLVTAGNLDQATDIAKGCPIFDYGGTVEVRPTMLMQRP